MLVNQISQGVLRVLINAGCVASHFFCSDQAAVRRGGAFQDFLLKSVIRNFTIAVSLFAVSVCISVV